LLRTFQDSDLEDFVAYRSDPEVARYQGWEAPFSRQQGMDFIAEMKAAQPGTVGKWFQFAVVRKAAPGIIGDVAFHVETHDPTQAFIGFTFAQAYQHQGFAIEAVRRLLDYLFGDLNLRRVCATCDVENKSSAHLLERLGLRREAEFIENLWFKGRWGSEYMYAILQHEWVKP
jgi:RimJ/RimL family protein N-acetyltransferase